MTELKLFLSQFHEEDFHDEVSGLTFAKSRKLEVHTLNVEGADLSGIQEAVRKNILLPFNLHTRNFLNSQNLAKPVAAVKAKVEEVAKVEVAKVEEVAVEAVDEVKEPAKKTRKRVVKKEESN